MATRRKSVQKLPEVGRNFSEMLANYLPRLGWTIEDLPMACGIPEELHKPWLEALRREDLTKRQVNRIVAALCDKDRQMEESSPESWLGLVNHLDGFLERVYRVAGLSLRTNPNQDVIGDQLAYHQTLRRYGGPSVFLRVSYSEEQTGLRESATNFGGEKGKIIASLAALLGCDSVDWIRSKDPLADVSERKADISAPIPALPLYLLKYKIEFSNFTNLREPAELMQQTIARVARVNLGFIFEEVAHPRIDFSIPYAFAVARGENNLLENVNLSLDILNRAQPN